MTLITEKAAKEPVGRRAVKRQANTSKIIAASINCLNKFGYSGTSLSVIANAAGVSRGQVQNIFGLRRTDLLARIAQEIFDRYVGEYLAACETASTPLELSDNMWTLIHDLYRRPETLALIEVWLATRNDRAFNRKLREMLTSMDDRVGQQWEAMFEAAGMDVGKVAVIRFFQRSVMRGLAIERLLGGPEEIFERILSLARKASADLLATP